LALQFQFPLALALSLKGEGNPVPLDPFDGALRYRRLERGYLIYSVDVDGRDDGGGKAGTEEVR